MASKNAWQWGGKEKKDMHGRPGGHPFSRNGADNSD